MTSRSFSPNNNRRRILIGLGTVVILLIIGIISLVSLLRNRNSGANEELEGLVAEAPTATITPTSVPSRTPTLTHTPTATPTGTPLPTATPSPMELTITGPRFVPKGLPVAVEWTISAASDQGVAIVSLEDLGGSMAIGDPAGNVVIAQTVSNDSSNAGLIEYEPSFSVGGIIDSNISQGLASFLIDNNLVSEPVSIPWTAIESTEVEYTTFNIVLDGIEDEIVFETADLSSTLPAAEIPGFTAYQTRNQLLFEYPESWFLSETQDDTVQISAEPLSGATGAEGVETSYALIVSGTREETGIPAEVEFTNDGIKAWLLGNLSNVGGEEVPILTESGLEIVSEYELPQRDGTVATAIELQSDGSEDVPPFKALYIINTVDDQTVIMTAYVPAESEEIDIFSQIAETITFGG